jgi:hypothetical protein
MVVHLNWILFAFDAAPTIVAPATLVNWANLVVDNLASLVTVLPVGPVQYYTIKWFKSNKYNVYHYYLLRHVHF